MHILAIGDDTGGYDLLMDRWDRRRSSGDHPGSGASRKVGTAGGRLGIGTKSQNA